MNERIVRGYMDEDVCVLVGGCVFFRFFSLAHTIERDGGDHSSITSREVCVWVLKEWW